MQNSAPDQKRGFQRMSEVDSVRIKDGSDKRWMAHFVLVMAVDLFCRYHKEILRLIYPDADFVFESIFRTKNNLFA